MQQQIAGLNEKLNTAATPTERIDVLCELAWALRNTEPKTGLAHAKEALHLSTSGDFASMPYQRGQLLGIRGMVACYSQLGEYGTSLALALENLPLFEQAIERRWLIQLLLSIGNDYYFLANYSEALNYFLRGLNLASEIGAERYKMELLDGVAFVYLQTGDVPKATETYRQTLQICETIDSPRHQTTIYNNAALIFSEAGDYPMALQYGLTSLQVARHYHFGRLEADVLDTIGSIYLKQHNYQRALTYFERGLQLARQMGARSAEMSVLLSMGRTYHQLQDDRTLLCLRQALALAEQLDTKSELFECHRLLAEEFERRGDSEQALLHYKQFFTIEKEVFNQKTSDRLKNLEILHRAETAKKEAEIAHLRTVELENEVRERQRAEDAARALARRMAALAELSRDISATLDLTNVLNRLAVRTHELFRASTVAISMAQPDGTMRPIVVLGDDAQAIKAHVVVPGVGIMGRVVQTGQAELVANSMQDERGILIPGTSTENWHNESMLCAPLTIDGQVQGLLTVWNHTQPHIYKQDDLDFLVNLSRHAAIAINNASLFDEAQRARQEAEAANLAKSRFFAGVSHELRTPLNIILGFTQLMAKDESMTAEHRETLETITNNGEYLLNLINDLLDIAKIEAGRVTITEQVFDLYGMLANLEAAFRLKCRAKGLSFVIEWQAVPQYIRTDEQKLRQILINLLNNAIKFTETGGVTVAISSVDQDNDAARLTFSVVDTGSGIYPEELDTLFDPFVQAQAGRIASEGTGLGLPLSRQYVRLLGGELKVASEVGQGTTFSFDIVVNVAQADDVPDKHDVGAPLLPVNSAEPYRILAVDDRRESRILLRRLLEPLGFAVKEAADGQEAIDLWRSWHPQLILMDVFMPVLDGNVAARRIKAAGGDVVIIALTASDIADDAHVLPDGLYDDVLQKPFRREALYRLLHTYLNVQLAVEPHSMKRPPAPKRTLSAEDMAQCPPDWLKRLRRALLSVDLDGVEALLAERRADQPHVVAQLRTFVENYEYDTVLNLIQSSVDKSQP